LPYEDVPATENSDNSRKFVYEHRIAWVETDAMGIVHFSNYFRLCERTEQEFMHHLGVKNRQVFLPRVHATCDYKYPLKYDQEARITMVVEEVGKRHITFNYDIINKTEERVSAKCKVVVVPVLIDMKPAKVGEDILSLLEPYVIKK
jgi:acyl-CoA thioester hydrolase